MNKKYFMQLLTIMMVMLFGVGLVSCGDDDGSQGGSSTPVEASKSAKIGDIYYSDGTCSSSLAAGKTPIGIVAYVGEDPVSENRHGLVMALHDLGQKSMLYYGNLSHEITYTGTTMSDRIADMGGLDKTVFLSLNGISAAVSAVEYDVATPQEATGWFIPSIGQWIAVVNAFGAGITEENEKGDAKVFTNINSALQKTGEEEVDYTPLSCHNQRGQYGYYWSSSFKDNTTVLDIVFAADSTLYLGASPNGSALYVRPFFAF